MSTNPNNYNYALSLPPPYKQNKITQHRKNITRPGACLLSEFDWFLMVTVIRPSVTFENLSCMKYYKHILNFSLNLFPTQI